MLSVLRRLYRNQRAATLIEYSLIVCLIASAAIGGMTSVGHAVLTRLLPVMNALN